MHCRLALLVLACTPGLISCRDITPPLPTRASHDLQSPRAPDEEFFGDIWLNGQRATASYAVGLYPLDATTAGRLRGPQLYTQLSNPTGRHMFGWYDPAGGGGCGGLASYNTGDTVERLLEDHLPQLPYNGVERHCLRPGQYQFSLADGKSFFLDYVQPVGSDFSISNITAGVQEKLEAIEYDSTVNDNNWVDQLIHVDLTPGTYAEAGMLDVDNSHDSPLSLSFVNEASPAGTEFDFFRFSLARSQSSWPHDTRGRMLARLYWDFEVNKSIGTHYFDAHSVAHMMRWHQFYSHVAESRNAVVALELMRPDEAPDDTINVATRTVGINRTTPVACAAFEATATWRTTDQIFNASCSTRGSNIQYRWRFTAGGTWTAYSSDTSYSFTGHTAGGTPVVSVQVRNASTGYTSTASYPFSVAVSAFTLDGRIFVTDKARNLYRNIGGAHGFWFERFNPEIEWIQATYEEADAMYRIWYAGDYTVSLRQQHWYPGGTLARGRLEITVCNPCGGGFANAESPDGIFGVGPWLSWGSGNALRFYDLLGAHDVANRFTDRAWLDSDSGRATETGAGSLLSWRRRSTLDSNARIIEFALAASPNPFTFGLALDPDLGPNAADDATGFDATRGMVYVTDGTRAAGYLLRDERGRNAITGVTQYGLQRHPPRLPQDIASAQRTTQVSLLSGRSDVQLLLTTAERPGPVSWSLIMVRGSSLAELQPHADAALAQLTTR